MEILSLFFGRGTTVVCVLSISVVFVVALCENAARYLKTSSRDDTEMFCVVLTVVMILILF